MSITQRGRKFKKGIIYPIFYEVSQKCEDEYWKQFFLDLSIGKIIRNIIIGNGNIFCTNKKNSFEYNFVNKSSDIIIKELIPILISNFVTCSEKHIKIKNIVEQIKKENDELKNGKWSKIRRKNLKISLLLEYISEFQNKNNLNWNDCAHVYEILSNNINSHIMTKIIHLEHGKIQNIEGLNIDKDGNICFENIFYSSDKNMDVEILEIEDEKKEEKFELQWDLYIKRYFKKIRMMLS